MARIFVVSDTHFFHHNMYGFLRADGTKVRPLWDNASDADREMVERWNSVVTPEDHIYHLGDVTMLRSSADIARFIAFIHTLNGHKRLILGNHDHFPVQVYREAGFQKIKGSHRIDRWAMLTHIPVHPDNLPRDGVNIHGHIHERLVMRLAGPSMDCGVPNWPPMTAREPDPRYRNVSVEQINYTPVLLESLKP